MSKIGIILSGCGVFDGSEIYETTCTLLSLDRLGHEVVCMAPDAWQMHVVDHNSGDDMPETRSVFTEAARLARGNLKKISDVDAATLDALVLPGGFGAAKNLSDFAIKGSECNVHPEVEATINAMHSARKPMAFLCIAPAIAARVLGEHGVELTIGNDADTAKELEAMGAKHFACAVDGYVFDKKQKVLSTPAYMLGKSISEVADGIDKTMRALDALL